MPEGLASQDRLMAAPAEVLVAGRKLKLSNLGKVLYPKAGFTKAEVIDYYTQIAPVLLPHLKGRPLTLKRYPDGVEGSFFYEKRCPKHRPKWVATTSVWSDRQGKTIDYCMINNLPSLVWAANLADLELHTSLSKGSRIDRPTAMAFDLDPGPGTDIVQCLEVAFALKEFFDGLELASFLKTSGSKGAQVYVPLNSAADYSVTKKLAHAIARAFESSMPKLVVSDMKKEVRKGRVLIDWSQNDQHKTTVCVYSLRAKDLPTVSTPIPWDEAEEVLGARDPGLLVFGPDDVLARVKKMGDLFEPVIKMKQKLPTNLPLIYAA